MNQSRAGQLRKIHFQNIRIILPFSYLNLLLAISSRPQNQVGGREGKGKGKGDETRMQRIASPRIVSKTIR